MIANGNVEMHISMNVIDLETDAVGINRLGNPDITNPDQFFMDWIDHWNRGVGELSGASTEYVDIETEDDD